MTKPWKWQRQSQSIYTQGKGLIVDNFAGGGGASIGIEQSLGRPIDIAIDHDPEAIAMHSANHPHTRHYCDDVFAVDPVTACQGQPVELAWFSPDCKHHSRAKGGKPVDKNIRGLAWVAVRWAATVRPRVVVLENVPEFEDWGPLTADNRPCPVRRGQTFRRFVRELERHGYHVDWRQLRACDYGAPTIRKRLFLIARCDGQSIVWPKATHGSGLLTPYNVAADCIDWSLPCPSIFTRDRPLAKNTLDRIAQGVQRFVLDAAEPFIVTCNHSGGGRMGQSPERPVTNPFRNVPSKANAALVAAFLAKHCTGVNSLRHQDMWEPTPTITAGGNHGVMVAALIAPYYGSGSGTTGRDLRTPVPTVTSRDRLQLITVEIDKETYVLTDIGMRMLQPHELYRAQGFPDSYIITPTVNGKIMTKAAQVRMCGNSVPPPFSRAIVDANLTRTFAVRT